MRLLGLLRVKNEARWIDQALASIKSVCDAILVMDDHSEDNTPEICEAAGATVLRSTFWGLDERRDKQFLLEQARELFAPEWALLVDGDEVLDPQGPEIIRAVMDRNCGLAYSLKIAYLWDRLDQVRVDGVYGRFTRPSLFKVRPGDSFGQTCHGGNFHCGSIPRELFNHVQPCPARLLHLGYMLREDRLRKYAWYNRIDPHNASEDGYRHMVQGDIPEVPATERLLHAGPLRLETLC